MINVVVNIVVKKLRITSVFCFLYLLLFSCLLLPASSFAEEAGTDVVDVVHHELFVTISPLLNTLSVQDTMTIPDSMLSNGRIDFYLHADLSPKVTTEGVSLKKLNVQDEPSNVPLTRLSLRFAKEKLIDNKITLSYRGKIHHPVEQLGAEYARSFSVSPGIISQDGVFLSNSSYWYPHFSNALYTFQLQVILPQDWSSVSQGQRLENTIEADNKRTTWLIDQPQDEIYLIAAKFKEYKQASGAVESMVFLREADDQLAQKYLDATAQYVEMYRKLLGPYPYKKFALVENFWETGYGMPSFTLLGPKVIRFPFILHSSYPHEILHNWWGNGVFVDYKTGNWAEGLTSYLADHLIKEQRGQAVNYRRNSLQKYTDFVNESRDFPLNEFRSRHNATTEAVGYGKTLMFFHMLRRQLGDQQFIHGLQTFYRKYRFKYAAFADIRDVFEQVTELDLKPMFEQWVERTGAPALLVTDAEARKTAGGYVLTVGIEQIQDDEVYELHVPIAITLEGQSKAHQLTETINTRRHTLKLTLPDRPVRVDIDPEFDVFRRLDLNEIPPALTKAFAAEDVLIVLPVDAPEDLKQAYMTLAKTWQRGQRGLMTIIFDDELPVLPTDQAVWLFGWQNHFRDSIVAALPDHEIQFSDESVIFNNKKFSKKENSIVLTARNPAEPEYALTWLSNENIAAMAGLGRKLPHYGRYSFLGFEGDEPSNMAKGQWPVVNSPMSLLIAQSDNKNILLNNSSYQPSQALAQLPSVFSEKRMLDDIQVLASEQMAGRGLGSDELNDVADYIAGEFAKVGLQKGADNDSYFQRWSEDLGSPVKNLQLKNVIGILPGSNAAFAGQSLLVTAHYDHLGRGWPDVHKGDEGKIHYGADDNASGVAVMLETLRIIAKKGPPERTIIFIAFSGEEAGRRGSLHYIKHVKDYPLNKIMAVVNLDTVGRLGKNKLTVFGTGSATEWVHIFRGTGFVTGINIQSVKKDFGSSDQRSFLDVGVPAVQFFAGVNADFHRPGDTIDKIDSAGLVKVATVLKETVEYLAAREQPLHSTLTKTNKNNTQPPRSRTSKGRKVSLGTVPDFAFAGNGVRITGVTEGSPAQAAGLAEGDIIIQLNNKAIADLREFSALLRSLKTNDQITIVYKRNGKQFTVSTRVVAR